MITVITVPSGTASATTATYAIQIKENICSSCTTSPIDINVNYSIESQSVVDGTVIANIKAVVVNTNRRCDCCEAKSFIHTERFPVAFTATGTNTIEIVKSDPVVTYADYKCCRPGSFIVNQTIVATIS